MGYLDTLALESGISVWLLLIIIVWTAIWKLLGLWKSARNTHIAWFIVIALLNTAGILPILYIYVFSKMGKKKAKKTAKKKVTKKSKKKKK